MSDTFSFTLESPLTKEQINLITDAEFEHTDRIWFDTPKGKHVEFVKAQQWIPCSERLPEDDGRYLCMTKSFNDKPLVDLLSYAHNLHKVDEYDFPQEKNGWYDYDDEYGYYEDEQVYAWMPLPEPWKGEGV